jgi:hypothetical protein
MTLLDPICRNSNAGWKSLTPSQQVKYRTAHRILHSLLPVKAQEQKGGNFLLEMSSGGERSWSQYFTQ